MADAMVTGRMTKAKKDAGNTVLSSMGMTASEAINELYDYLIVKKTLPFAQEKKKTPSPSQIRKAKEFILSIPVHNQFSKMTDEQIKHHKLNKLLAQD